MTWLNKFDVRSKRKDGEESILERYQRLRKILDDDNEQSKEYRKELLGPEVISSATQEYYILATMFELKISPHEWEAYPLRLRGKLIAYQRLRAVEQLLERHEREQDRRRKSQSGQRPGQATGRQGHIFGSLRG